MPVYSLVGGVQTEYAIAGGKPVVRLKSVNRIRLRAAYTGIAILLFHWVQEGKTQAWRFDPSIPDPQTIEPEETTDNDGSQLLTFTLGELLPAAGLLRRRWEGALFAPAIHIDVPFGSDVWIFLVRSPWFPLTLSITKETLAVSDSVSVASASVRSESNGSLSATISTTGTAFKSVSLEMTRKIGQLVSQEPIGRIETGSGSYTWSPIIRNFDLCLVTSGSMRLEELANIAQGLGADFSSGFFGPGSLNGDFLLCDGPMTDYWLTLKADQGLFRHVEDSTTAVLKWAE